MMCKEESGFWALDMVVINDEVWFLNGDSFSIWKYNLMDDVLEYVSIPPNKNTYSGWLYSRILMVDSNLYLIPYCTDTIEVFDTKEDKWREPILLPVDSSNGARFTDAIVFDGKIVCFPEYKPDKVFFIDISNCNVESENIWNRLPEDATAINEIKIVDSGVVAGIIRFTAIMFFYDMKTNEIRFLYGSDVDGRWNTFGVYNDRVFVNGPDSYELIEYDINSFEKISCRKIDLQKTRIKSIDNRLLIDSTSTDDCYLYDVKTGSTISLELSDTISESFNQEYKVGILCIYQDKIIYHDRRHSVLEIINYDDIQIKELTVPEYEIKKLGRTLIVEKMRGPFLENETNMMGLEEMIFALKEKSI